MVEKLDEASIAPEGEGLLDDGPALRPDKGWILWSLKIFLGMTLAGFIVALLSLIPNMRRAQAGGHLTACKSNLKNIATAMEMYSTDWSGHYAASLDQLIPRYLEKLPSCPVTGTVTYKMYSSSNGEKVKGNEKGYKYYYYIECAGGNHGECDIDGDFPAYNGIIGLIERQY